MSEINLEKLGNRSGTRLLLVDDHPLFCDAMAMTMGEIFPDPEIYTASTLGEALAGLQYSKPDLIVLDLNLPDVEGVDGLVRLRNEVPDTKIVVVSSLSENRVIAAVIDAHASGFVPKNSSRAELVQAFQHICDGETYTPPEFVAPSGGALEHEQQSVLRRLESLTPQQSRILVLLGEGKLNKQIAFELTIAETTVKAHLTAILRKLGVQNRTQAVLLANKVSYFALST